VAPCHLRSSAGGSVAEFGVRIIICALRVRMGDTPPLLVRLELGGTGTGRGRDNMEFRGRRTRQRQEGGKSWRKRPLHAGR
jgi:hypothetical protein